MIIFTEIKKQLSIGLFVSLVVPVLLSLFCSPKAFSQTNKIEEKPTILFIYPVDKGFPFWDSQVDFAQSVSNALNFQLDVAYTPKSMRNRFTAAKYLKQLIESKRQKPSLVLSSFWVGSEEGILTYLDKNKIPLITINSDITSEQFKQLGLPRQRFPYWLAHLSPNDTFAGEQLAQAILNESRDLRCDSNFCEVNIFAITGSSHSAVSHQRANGLKTAIEQDRKSKILNIVHGNWARNLVAKMMKTVFLRHKKIDAFWVASDVMAYGIKDGLDKQNKKLPATTVVGSIDWSPSSINKIKQHEMNMSLGGHFMEGGWGIILFFDYLNGKDFIEETSSVIKTEMSILNNKNADVLGRFLSAAKWSNIHLRSYSKFLNPKRKVYDFNPKSMIMEQILVNQLKEKGIN